MANICINTLEFSGEEKNIESVYALFQELKKYNEEIKEGAMPDFVNHKEGYFFDLYVEKDCSIGYWTKWTPNEAVVKDIADKYKVDFTLAYSELACGLFGQVFYNFETQTITEVFLTDAEMDVVECDDNGFYYYNGEEIESPEEIYQQLLEKKIKETLK